jgi:nicotinate-nucleotide pyrophosphorylase (carboxylating)
MRTDLWFLSAAYGQYLESWQTAMKFTDAETNASQRLIALALDEDLDGSGDLTSQAILPAELAGRAAFVARTEGILAGLPAVGLVLAGVDPHLALQTYAEDGARLQRGVRFALVTGPMRSLLTAERTALNFLQRLSGVATQTARFVSAVAGTRASILDTRKTTPGWRLLEKYAVRCGGGQNHRMGLYDGVLIKDNHLAALAAHSAAITEAVRVARGKHGQTIQVEIEIDRLDQLDEALACGPDIVLLDNMSPADMIVAVRRRDAVASRVLLEASGGVTLATVGAIAATGVDRISVGQLTHSAPALDIALDYESGSGMAT